MEARGPKHPQLKCPRVGHPPAGSRRSLPLLNSWEGSERQSPSLTNGEFRSAKWITELDEPFPIHDSSWLIAGRPSRVPRGASGEFAPWLSRSREKRVYEYSRRHQHRNRAFRLLRPFSPSKKLRECPASSGPLSSGRRPRNHPCVA